MNEQLIGLLVQERQAALIREAEREALARTSRAERRSRGLGISLMPHVQELRRIGRRLVALISPAAA